MSKIDREAILELTPAERLALIDMIWDTLDDDDIPLLTEREMAILDERLEEHRRNPDSAVPWEEVRARLWALENETDATD